MVEQPLTHNARLSVAPMMDWTDRHCRFLHRLLSQEALLYTEMVTSPALVRGQAFHLLDHSQAEHPVALQLGGSEPHELAQAAKYGAEAGFVEINLNCGCPSDRVQSGAFGAVLMEDAGRVAECVSAMRAAVDVDVTVKCRIGVDDQDPEIILPEFLARIVAAGCERVTIHARKAWLQGLSPKENRDIPPLDYELVAQLKAERPDLKIILNGGITDLAECKTHLDRFDGVMLGRAPYQQPSLLGQVDGALFDPALPAVSPFAAIDAYRPYMQARLDEGLKLSAMTRHMLGLFNGMPGARLWRRVLSEKAPRPGADLSVLDEAVEMVTHRMEDA